MQVYCEKSCLEAVSRAAAAYSSLTTQQAIVTCCVELGGFPLPLGYLSLAQSAAA